MFKRSFMEHKMKLAASPFQMIKSGQKTIELRLYDEKRRILNVGDIIEFTDMSDNSSKITARVLKLHIFDDFTDLYGSLPLTKCGYTQGDLLNAKPSDMDEFYSREEQERYGVVGIELSLINTSSGDQ